MSLRGFHLVFISLTTLLSVFMAVWAIFLAPTDAGVVKPLLLTVGLLGVVGFPVYGVYFYRKAKNLIL